MTEDKTRTFTFPQIVPIPVGHRVELRFFLQDAGGWKQRLVPCPTEPLVIDLDTGVEYGNWWHYSDAAGVKGNCTPPNEYPLAQRASLETFETVTGRVLSCRVLTEAMNTMYHAQTTLVLDVSTGV